MQFDQLLKSGQASVLAQAGRFGSVKKSLTATAATLVTAAMLAVSVAPQNAHANGTLERIAKDALGGATGAAIFGQFGKGKGRDAMRVIGAVAGVTVAESLQRPQPQTQTYTFSSSAYQGGSVQPSNSGFSLFGSGSSLPSGTEPLALDKREKLSIQERNAMQARDSYARSLFTLQQAEENQVLNPRSRAAQQELSAASSTAQVALQQYAAARGDFMNACEFMGRRGYDVQEFNHSYTLLQGQVTARDMHPKDMAEIEVQRRPSLQPAY